MNLKGSSICMLWGLCGTIYIFYLLESTLESFIQMLNAHHFAHKGLYNQSYGFSSSHLWMWELDHKEDWAPKNCFRLSWWRRLLRVPLTARRSNQSILKEINPGYSLEGLKLKLQYYGHLIQRADSLEKDPDATKAWGQEKGATEGGRQLFHQKFLFVKITL